MQGYIWDPVFCSHKVASSSGSSHKDLDLGVLGLGVRVGH